MTYTIVFTDKFKKMLRGMTQKEQKQFERKVALLMENPRHPSLRTKRIQGVDNLFEFSVNMSVRVLWQYENGNIILLLAIGKHDILKMC